jgi:hypothetical protein
MMFVVDVERTKSYTKSAAIGDTEGRARKPGKKSPLRERAESILGGE